MASTTKPGHAKSVATYTEFIGYYSGHEVVCKLGKAPDKLRLSISILPRLPPARFVLRKPRCAWPFPRRQKPSRAPHYLFPPSGKPAAIRLFLSCT